MRLFVVSCLGWWAVLVKQCMSMLVMKCCGTSELYEARIRASYTSLVYGVAGASDVGVWDEVLCGELLGVVGCTGQTVYVYACDEVLRDLRTLRGSYTSLVYEPRIRGGRGVG